MLSFLALALLITDEVAQATSSACPPAITEELKKIPDVALLACRIDGNPERGYIVQKFGKVSRGRRGLTVSVFDPRKMKNIRKQPMVFVTDLGQDLAPLRVNRELETVVLADLNGDGEIEVTLNVQLLMNESAIYVLTYDRKRNKIRSLSVTPRPQGELKFIPASSQVTPEIDLERKTINVYSGVNKRQLTVFKVPQK